MDGEGILLRQSKHVLEVISKLNEKNFAETFGDIQIVFTDGIIHFYKAFLLSLSPMMEKILLGDSEGPDVIILEKTKKADFFQCMITLDKEFPDSINDIKLEVNEDVPLIEESVDDANKIPIVESEIVTKTKPLTTVPKTYSYVSETVIRKEIVDNDEKTRKSGKKILSCIVPNFSWPTMFQGPNYHSIRWGQTSRSMVVVEVMGNRSIFTVLAEKQKNLPSITEFIITGPDNRDLSGTFYLMDFVNSGADKDTVAFMLPDKQKELSLVELIKYAGYENMNNMVENASQNIKVQLSVGYEELGVLIKTWKENLIADTKYQEMKSSPKLDRDVMRWLQTEAQTSPDGGLVCCYCGLICYEQSLSGNFWTHMQKHLYRKSVCRKCHRKYLPYENHRCSIIKKIERVPCKECGKTFGSRNNLVVHLRGVHSIIEKVVVIRECLFCSQKVENLSEHCYKFHKNEHLSCQDCDKVFSNPSKFKTHIDMVHKKIYSGYCTICEKEKLNLIKHNVQCHNKKSYKCDHCDKVYKHEGTLKDHLSSVNGTRAKKPCPECGNLYVNLNDHINRFHKGHKKTKNVKYCFNCQKSYHKDIYDDHKLHCKEEMTVCHICSKKVLVITNHLAKYHQIYERKCRLCESDFRTNEDLNQHLKNEHFPRIMLEPGFDQMSLKTEDVFQREALASKFVAMYSTKSEDQIECSFCKYRTITVINMITHMKEHLGFTFRKGKAPNPEKETVCPDCGKMVRSPVKEHMKKCKIQLDKSVAIKEDLPDLGQNIPITNQLLLYPCSHCTMQFKKEFNLIKHLQNKHVESKTELENCSLQSTVEMGLISEESGVMNTATKQLKYACELCNKIFKKEENLVKHTKVKHDEAFNSLKW